MTIKEKIEKKSRNSSLISHQFSKDSIYSISWLFIFRISGIISTIIIANVLLTKDYGIYSVLSSWGLILNYICTMGIPISAAKIISENRVKNPERNFTLFGNMILIILINLIATFIFSIFTLNFFSTTVYKINFNEIQTFESLLLLTVLDGIIFTIFSLEQGIATGYREFKVIALIFIIGYSLRIPIIYIFTYNYQLIGVFSSEIISDSIILLFFFIFLIKFFKKNNLKFVFKIQKKELRSLYSLGISPFLSNLIFIVVNWFGLTILSTYFSFNDVGNFQTSLNIVNLIFIIPYGIISPFLPEITEKYELNLEDFYRTIPKVLKLIVLIIFPIIILVGLFCPLLINIFYPKYYNLITFYSAYILLPYIFINGFTQVYFYSFISMGKSRILIMMETCKAITFFIFIFILVPTYGIIGFSYVFFLSFLIYTIVYQFVNKRYNFKFYATPFILLSILYIGFLFYSLIFSIINLSSIIWIICALFITVITTITSFFQLWKDSDCKNFILSFFNIFKKNPISDQK